MTFKAASRRERVYFERHDEVPDSYGNVTSGWTRFPSASAQYWADILERTGKEAVQAGAVNAPKTATIRVRKTANTSALTEADRMVARGQTWNIRSIVQLDRKGSMIEMLVEAGVAT